MVGKTIKSVKKYGAKGFDDEGTLEIVFTDGTSVLIHSCYDNYTGKSQGEYPCSIIIDNEEKIDDNYYLVEEIK